MEEKKPSDWKSAKPEFSPPPPLSKGITPLQEAHVTSKRRKKLLRIVLLATVLTIVVLFILSLAVNIVRRQIGTKNGAAQQKMSPKTKYRNPFESNTKYVNPFSGYKNPFADLRR